MATKIKLTKNDWKNRFKEFKKTDKKYAKFPVFKNTAIDRRLLEFEVSEEKMAGDAMLVVLGQLENEFANAKGKLTKKEEPDLFMLLEGYLVVIRDNKSRAKDIMNNPQNAADAPARQKTGSLKTFWEDTISNACMKKLKLKSTPPNFSCKLQLTVDKELLNSYAASGDAITINLMIKDCQAIAAQARFDIQQAFTKCDNTIYDELRNGAPEELTKKRYTVILNNSIARHLKKAKDDLSAVPTKHFEAWKKRDASRKKFSLKSKAIVGAIMLSSAWQVAKIGGSAGLLLIPSIHTLAKNALALGKMVDSFHKQAEKIESRLIKNLIKIQKEYAKGAKKADAKAAFFKWATGQDNPWAPSIVSARSDLEMLKFKLNQQFKKALELSALVTNGLDDLEKAEKDFKKSDLKSAEKLLPQIKAMRKVLDASFEQCHAIMARHSKFERSRGELEKILKGLEGKGDLFKFGQETLLSGVIGVGIIESVQITSGDSLKAARNSADKMLGLVT